MTKTASTFIQLQFAKFALQQQLMEPRSKSPSWPSWRLGSSVCLLIQIRGTSYKFSVVRARASSGALLRIHVPLATKVNFVFGFCFYFSFVFFFLIWAFGNCHAAAIQWQYFNFLLHPKIKTKKKTRNFNRDAEIDCIKTRLKINLSNFRFTITNDNRLSIDDYR